MRGQGSCGISLPSGMTQANAFPTGVTKDKTWSFLAQAVPQPRPPHWSYKEEEARRCKRQNRTNRRLAKLEFMEI